MKYMILGIILGMILGSFIGYNLPLSDEKDYKKGDLISCYDDKGNKMKDIKCIAKYDNNIDNLRIILITGSMLVFGMIGFFIVDTIKYIKSGK